ncbi:MAG: hypothetical protein ACR2M5_03625 [Nakamurella sp.]
MVGIGVMDVVALLLAALLPALGDFLSIVTVICVLALLSLYLLGPTERSLRKVESAAESVIPA